MAAHTLQAACMSLNCFWFSLYLEAGTNLVHIDIEYEKYRGDSNNGIDMRGDSHPIEYAFNYSVSLL